MLRVCHITFDTSGGAGIAACRIVDALEQSGQVSQSRLFFGRGDACGWRRLSLPSKTSIKWHLNRLAVSAAKKAASQPAEPLSFAHFGRLATLPQDALDADVVHFHWAGGGLFDFKSIARNWPQKLPLVWTLHDLNPVMACGHYLQERNVQWSRALEDRWFNLFGRRIVTSSLRAKRALFGAAEVHLVGTSEWLCQCAQETEIGRCASSISKIAYPLQWPELEGFNKSALREELDLPIDRPVVCFGAADVGNPRKGFQYVERLMQNPRFKELHWAVFGAGQLPQTALRMKHFGRVYDAFDLNKIYAASDLLIMPSEEEAFGQVAAEALACGTPVICFSNTGTCDLVIHSQTGLVVDPTTPEALDNAVKKLLSDRMAPLSSASVQGAFREFWMENMKPKRVAESYLNLYQRIA